MDIQKIGSFIAEARKKKSMTQVELGEHLNVTGKAVSKWECGKCLPDSSLFEDISKVLDVSMNELLKGEYIEEESVEAASNKSIILLLHEIQKLKRNGSLMGALCAILVSFVTAIYSLIWTPSERSYEQFFSGFINGISGASLVVGIILIFYTWVKYSEKNKN